MIQPFRSLLATNTVTRDFYIYRFWYYYDPNKRRHVLKTYHHSKCLLKFSFEVFKIRFKDSSTSNLRASNRDILWCTFFYVTHNTFMQNPRIPERQQRAEELTRHRWRFAKWEMVWRNGRCWVSLSGKFVWQIFTVKTTSQPSPEFASNDQCFVAWVCQLVVWKGC